MEGKLTRPKPRVVKAPTVRRAELIGLAQQLFMAKGYERTTINDVIAAAGLSKGAFYHHFRAKEDLLEAIAAKSAEEALLAARAVGAGASLGALDRLNRLLAVSRQWKAEHLGQLKAMFTVLLRPENTTLYRRIVEAVFQAMAPTVLEIIADGVREGVFDVADADLAAEALLWMGETRRSLVVAALQLAEQGEVDRATAIIVERVRAEEATVDRLLGLREVGVNLAGSEAFIRRLIVDWCEAPALPDPPIPTLLVPAWS